MHLNWGMLLTSSYINSNTYLILLYLIFHIWAEPFFEYFQIYYVNLSINKSLVSLSEHL